MSALSATRCKSRGGLLLLLAAAISACEDRPHRVELPPLQVEAPVERSPAELTTAAGAAREPGDAGAGTSATPAGSSAAEIRLAPITGRTVLRDGRPVEASVVLVQLTPEGEVRHTVRSDPVKGAFAIDTVERADRGLVYAMRGTLLAVAPRLVGPDEHGLELVLEPSLPLEVTVSESNGETLDRDRYQAAFAIEVEGVEFPWLDLAGPMSMVLHVKAYGYLPAELSFPKPLAVHAPIAVVLARDPLHRASFDGIVLLPDELAQEVVFVVGSGPEGSKLDLRLDGEGRFRADDVPSGRWCLIGTAGGPESRNLAAFDFTEAGPESKSLAAFDLAPGSTLSLRIDLRAPTVFVDGEIRVDGDAQAWAGRPDAHLVMEGRTERSYAAPSDQEGHFRIGVTSTGLHRLEVRFGAWVLKDLLDLEEGVHAWRADVATGVLVVPQGTGRAVDLCYRWRGEGELMIETRGVPMPDGSVRFDPAPAGDGELWDGGMLEGKVTVHPGRTTRFERP